jgi:flavorubredoxin
VIKKIREVLALGLPVDMICASHGVIWRQDPVQIVEKYLQWSDAYRENQITIVYDTMWNGTRLMAEQIARGIGMADPEVMVKIYNAARSDKNDIITDIFRSKGVVFGSPTVNRGILSSIAALLEEVKGLKFREKKAAAFGCYGWSGESVRLLADLLANAGVDIAGEGLRVLWNPDAEGLRQCVEFGKSLAAGMI